MKAKSKNVVTGPLVLVRPPCCHWRAKWFHASCCCCIWASNTLIIFQVVCYI